MSALALNKVRSTFGVVYREWLRPVWGRRALASVWLWLCWRKAAGRGKPVCLFASAPHLLCALFTHAAQRAGVQLRAEGGGRGGRSRRRIAARWGGLARMCAWVRVRMYTATVIVCAANAAARRQHDKIKPKSAYKKLMPRLTAPLYANVELRVLSSESGTLSLFL